MAQKRPARFDMSSKISRILEALITAAIIYIATSVNTLTQQMAVVVQGLVAHEKRIERLENTQMHR